MNASFIDNSKFDFLNENFSYLFNKNISIFNQCNKKNYKKKKLFIE